jgi:hypothetical protein
MMSHHVRVRIAFWTTLVWSTIAGCSKVPIVWVSRQEHHEVPVETATGLAATTHNGTQTAVGVAEQGDKVVIEANVRGGGATLSDARKALEAIVVSAEREGETINLGWDWKTAQKPGWGAEVAFDIKLPPRLNVKLVTHNGAVVARGIAGECVLETHNGQVTAQTGGVRLDASSHNGALEITTAAADVVLETHNGGISARLETAGDVGGRITTHNGGIVVVLAGSAAALLDCSTSNGRIHCDHNLEQVSVNQTSLKGSVRGGTKTLRIETSNGSIKIQ